MECIQWLRLVLAILSISYLLENKTTGSMRHKHWRINYWNIQFNCHGAAHHRKCYRRKLNCFLHSQGQSRSKISILTQSCGSFFTFLKSVLEHRSNHGFIAVGMHKLVKMAQLKSIPQAYFSQFLSSCWSHGLMVWVTENVDDHLHWKSKSAYSYSAQKKFETGVTELLKSGLNQKPYYWNWRID